MYDLHDVQLPIDSGTVGEFVFKDNAKVFPQRPLRAPQPQVIRPRRTPAVHSHFRELEYPHHTSATLAQNKSSN